MGLLHHTQAVHGDDIWANARQHSDVRTGEPRLIVWGRQTGETGSRLGSALRSALVRRWGLLLQDHTHPPTHTHARKHKQAQAIRHQALQLPANPTARLRMRACAGECSRRCFRRCSWSAGGPERGASSCGMPMRRSMRRPPTTSCCGVPARTRPPALLTLPSLASTFLS